MPHLYLIVLETGTTGSYVMSTVPGIALLAAVLSQLCNQACSRPNAIILSTKRVHLLRKESNLEASKPTSPLFKGQWSALTSTSPFVVNQAFNEQQASGEQPVPTAGTASNLQRLPAFQVWRACRDKASASVTCLTGPLKAFISHSFCFRELHASPLEVSRQTSLASAQV